MDTEFLRKVKRLVIIAMFSDDDLMDMLVLKGGNALDIIHQIEHRASVDLDFSIERDFRQEDLLLSNPKFKRLWKKHLKQKATRFSMLPLSKNQKGSVQKWLVFGAAIR